MLHAIFVVPYAMETTLRFVRSVAALPEVALGIISQEPPDKLPKDLRSRVSEHVRVKDAQDLEELSGAVRALARRWDGRVDRLLGILEQLQEPLARVREQLGIRGMSVDEAKNFRDKARMKDLLRAGGLPCARHGLAETKAEALEFAKTCLPLVVKPPDGAGAKNTMRVDTLEELTSYMRIVPPTASSPILLEEFITGRERSFDSVTLNGRHLFHSISLYYPTPLEVMQQPGIQWCVVLPREIDGPEYANIREAGTRALDVLGMVTGLTHMEWFQREDGSIAISEVAARPPGAQFTTLLSFAHDMDFYKAWAELMVHETFQPPAREYATGAVFLRGQGQGKVKAVRGVEQAKRELGELVVQSRLPQPGQAQASSYEGEGYVILRHPETREVEAGLRRLLELLEIELG